MARNIVTARRTGSLKGSTKISSTRKPSTPGVYNKSRVSKSPRAVSTTQQKTKPVKRPAKQKRRLYTEKELGLPQLNMITPVGVEKPKGKKKGKVFVDDPESMMTILAMVTADKEGQIESRMMKSRQLEEIREARKKEAELRQEQKKSRLEETKDSIRKQRKRGKYNVGDLTSTSEESSSAKNLKPKKRVSFG